MRNRTTSRRLPAAIVLLAVACSLAGACSTSPDLDLPPAIEVAVPATGGAALPQVADAGDNAILSWVEPAGTGHQLRFARWSGTAWSEPGTVAVGANWFVNWADFPSVIDLGGNALAAHWLQRSGQGTYAYDVLVSRSADGGTTWSDPVRPHTDGTQTEHGFVSLFPLGDALGVIWLDGRQFAQQSGEDGHAGHSATNEMGVRFTTLGGAEPGAELLLDGRACDCCQTDVAITARGPLVVYRDRSESEVRDISAVRLTDGEWTEPRSVHHDGWVINACPVNGPQVDARDNRVAVAWFSAADGVPQVNVAFSDDAGDSFAPPVRVDGGNPVGRADVLMLDDTRALVLWIERVEDGADVGAEVRARIVTSDGAAGEPRAIAETLAQRTSGFPRMARYPGGVLMAWTQPGEPSQLRAATFTLP